MASAVRLSLWASAGPLRHVEALQQRGAPRLPSPTGQTQYMQHVPAPAAMRLGLSVPGISMRPRAVRRRPLRQPKGQDSSWRLDRRSAFACPPGPSCSRLPVLAELIPVSEGPIGLPLSSRAARWQTRRRAAPQTIDRLRLAETPARSEEHTSELQSPCNLVCR